MQVLAISDTHGLHHSIWEKVLEQIDPAEFDMIVHSGDISSMGETAQVMSFMEWFGNLPFKNKVFILGNHEVLIEDNQTEELIRKVASTYPNTHFLHHETVEIEGFKIFGSPYTPYFKGWAYNVDRRDLHNYWDEIPLDVDLIITHGPPFGLGDAVGYKKTMRCGDIALLNKINEILYWSKKNIVHQFGHIHDSKGSYQLQDSPNIQFVNASCLTDSYTIQGKPYATYELHEKLSEETY